MSCFHCCQTFACKFQTKPAVKIQVASRHWAVTNAAQLWWRNRFPHISGALSDLHQFLFLFYLLSITLLLPSFASLISRTLLLLQGSSSSYFILFLETQWPGQNQTTSCFGNVSESALLLPPFSTFMICLFAFIFFLYLVMFIWRPAGRKLVRKRTRSLVSCLRWRCWN